jgi:hypothetical protein
MQISPTMSLSNRHAIHRANTTFANSNNTLQIPSKLANIVPS